MSAEIAVNSYEGGQMSVTPAPFSEKWTEIKEVM